MDPKANLKEQLDLAAQIVDLIDSRPHTDGVAPEELREVDEAIADSNEQIADLSNRLAELVLALDEWRRKGGFDPYTEVTT